MAAMKQVKAQQKEQKNIESTIHSKEEPDEYQEIEFFKTPCEYNEEIEVQRRFPIDFGMKN